MPVGLLPISRHRILLAAHSVAVLFIRTGGGFCPLSAHDICDNLKLLAVVNPVSGRGQAKAVWPALENELVRLGIEHSVEWTQHPGHAIAVAEQAANRGFTRVLSVGGDGTLREVIQGSLGTSVEIGLVPAGSGNDFGRTLGIPRDPRRALDVALETNVEQIDVGEIDGSAYVNVAGCGIDAEIASLAATKLRFLGGRLSYLSSALVQLAVHKPRRYKLTIDGETIMVHAYLVAAANGRYYGGGMMIAPNADPSDGLLDICVVRSMSKAAFAANLPRVYVGKHLEHPLVHVWRGRSVTVETDFPVRCQADGEIVASSPVRFQISQHQVPIVCPIELRETLHGR